MISAVLKDVFLRLVRLGIGHAEAEDVTGFPRLSAEEWKAVKTLAEEQGLLAVVLDGVDCLNANGTILTDMPKDIRLEWIGEVLQGYERRYGQYCRAIAEMAGFYNSHGFKMMVLKGYACSLDWPKPEHRPCGDIDIWQFGRWREADALLSHTDTPLSTDNSLVPKIAKTGKGSKFVIDGSHHHHTVFYWRDFMVENHYDFINVHHHRSNAEYEKILKKLGGDDSYSVELYGKKIFLPSPNLHALFLLKHMMLHFASEGIALRQLLDWGFFVKVHGKQVDWTYVFDVLDKFGMRAMFNIFNAVCVEDLGFESDMFPKGEFELALKDRVLSEMLSHEFAGELPSGLLKRVSFKIRRWRANGWKHKLCYTESMWSAFWSGVWNHMLKPSSI